MLFFIALVLGLFVFEALGYGIHWIFHQQWSGPLFRAHLVHHRLYPPRSYLSNEYRSAGAQATTWRFLAASLCLATAALWILPWSYGLAFCGELGAIGVLNDWVHSCIHVRDSWLGQTRWGTRMRLLHLVHHMDARRNLGIISFGMDRLLGTYLFR